VPVTVFTALLHPNRQLQLRPHQQHHTTRSHAVVSRLRPVTSFTSPAAAAAGAAVSRSVAAVAGPAPRHRVADSSTTFYIRASATAAATCSTAACLRAVALLAAAAAHCIYVLLDCRGGCAPPETPRLMPPAVQCIKLEPQGACNVCLYALRQTLTTGINCRHQ
jgi:hypothetical protein